VNFSTDWSKVKNEYVIGRLDASTGERTYPKQADLARKYKVSEASISLHASKEGWQQEREVYLKAVQDELKKKTIKFEAKSLEEIRREDLQIIKIAKSQWLKNKQKMLEQSQGFDVYDRDLIQFMKLEQEITELIHGTDSVSRLLENDSNSSLNGMSLSELIGLWRFSRNDES